MSTKRVPAGDPTGSGGQWAPVKRAASGQLADLYVESSTPGTTTEDLYMQEGPGWTAVGMTERGRYAAAVGEAYDLDPERIEEVYDVDNREDADEALRPAPAARAEWDAADDNGDELMCQRDLDRYDREQEEKNSEFNECFECGGDADTCEHAEQTYKDDEWESDETRRLAAELEAFDDISDDEIPDLNEEW